MMTKNQIKNRCAALFVLLLLACGSEQSITQEKPTSVPSITAFNKLASAPLNTPVVLDLSFYIEGEDILVNGVYSNTPDNCISYVDGNQSVNLQITKLGYCDFVYVVSDSNNNFAEAEITLISSIDGNPLLSPISFTTYLGKENNQINLLAEISDEIDENYFIQSAEVSETSQDAADLNIIPSDLTLDFITPATIGWYKISYVVNNTNIQDAKKGEVFISVGDKINQAPTISYLTSPYTESASWDHSAGLYKLSVDLNQLHCDDNKQNCLIEDEQYWTLTDVKSIASAKVSLPENSNLLNRRFEFEAKTSGFHDVSYVVSDNEGASSMGILRIYAYKETIRFDQVWSDDVDFTEKQDSALCSHLVNSNNYPQCRRRYDFVSPLTHIDAALDYDNLNFYLENNDSCIVNKPAKNTTDKEDCNENEVFLVATWSYETAKKNCSEIESPFQSSSSKYRRLPTIEEMKYFQKMNSETTTGKEKAWWPHEVLYFTEEGKLFDLSDGSEHEFIEEYQGNYTCFADRFEWALK